MSSNFLDKPFSRVLTPKQVFLSLKQNKKDSYIHIFYFIIISEIMDLLDDNWLIQLCTSINQQVHKCVNLGNEFREKTSEKNGKGKCECLCLKLLNLFSVHLPLQGIETT